MESAVRTRFDMPRDGWFGGRLGFPAYGRESFGEETVRVTKSFAHAMVGLGGLDRHVKLPVSGRPSVTGQTIEPAG